MLPQSPASVAVPSSRWRKPRNALLASGIGLVGALLAGELGLRLFLFQPSLNAGGLGRRIRQPARYSDGNKEDDYWKLLNSFRAAARIIDAPNHDPIVGWTSPSIAPGTYAHVDESSIHGRRPVILYGDSFARCRTMAEDSFPAIFERSEFAREYVLLNYGVGGYGLDQICLLLENSIDRFQGLDPIVIVGVLIEGDFERSVLSYRDWPKPRFDVVEDRLVVRGPVQTNVREYLERNPISIRSYLWRGFLHQQTPFMARQRAQWRGDARIEKEKQDLNRRILVEIEHELSSRHLQHFFLAFHTESGALNPSSGFEWQEQMLRELCAQFAVPLVDTRTYLSFMSDGRSEKCAQFYGKGAPLYGHHNALGNLVCFEALRQGLRGGSAAPEMQSLAIPNRYGTQDWVSPETTSISLLGRTANLITHGSAGRPRAMETSEPARLLLRADALGSTLARFNLSGGAKRFTGRLHSMAEAEEGCSQSELRFCVEVDDEIVLERNVPPASEALQLDVDLEGKRTLGLVVAGDRGGAACNWVCVEAARID